MSQSHAPTPLSDEITNLLKGVKLLALDVDGTLTDGRVIYVGDTETQCFDVQDGQGLVWLRRAGVKLAWITGRGSQPTKRRASELGVEFLVANCKDKRASLRAIQEELGIEAAQTLSMGDDLPDLALARESGCFAAPANARAEVLEAAAIVTKAAGGSGAVREVCELILRAKGQWQAIRSAAAR